MSTPSGKPFDPTHAPGFTRRTGEPAAASPPEEESDHSPYAPKRLRVVHSTEEGGDGVEVPRFLFEANRPRPSDLTRTAVGRSGIAGTERPSNERFAAERHPMDLDGLEHPLEPAGRAQPTRTAPAPQAPLPSQPSQVASAARPAASNNDTDDADEDIERLEASLRWLRRQDTDLRAQRASRPLPPAEPRANEPRASEPRASEPQPPTPLERMAERIRAKTMAYKTRQPGSGQPNPGQPNPGGQPKPLEPQSLVPPALRRRAMAEQKNAWRTPALIAIAIVAALPIAYLAVGLFSSPSDSGPPVVAADPPTAELVPLPQFTLDMPEPPTSAPAEEPVVAREARALLPQAMPSGETVVMRQPPAARMQLAAAPQPAAQPQPAPVAVAAPMVPVTPAPAPMPVTAAAPVTAPTAAPAPTSAPLITRRLDPAEIKLLVAQGEQFVAAGDMSAARPVFQRAAEAGDAGAAMALGATFDPTFLAKISVLGVSADLDKARNWYQRAKELGSQEAPRRLEMLANR